MPTLTRAEAAARSALLDIRSYQVELDLTDAEAGATFASVTRIDFACRRAGASSFVELEAARLLGAVLNGEPLDVTAYAQRRLPLPSLRSENLLVVTADCAYSNTSQGLNRFVDPADGSTYLYGMSFLDDAPRMFACFDQPDLKARVSLRVRAPRAWSVLGNGAGTRQDDGKAPAGAPRGALWTFPQTERLATYAVTLVAGPYSSLYRDHDGVRLGLHCRRALEPYLNEEAEELFTLTGQCLDHYHRLFERRYPWGGKYDQVFVPGANFGAMENPACVTVRDELLSRSAATDVERARRAVILAHELAHMWFGNLVSMRWWDDLWLNESFAEYIGYRTTAEATRFKHVQATFTSHAKPAAYAADQLPTTHPISCDVPDAAHALTRFDSISYAKGCSALRQLVVWLGDDTFLRGLRDYFERHAFGNADLSDLLAALERASGRDLRCWARVWLQTAQVNTLRPIVTQEGESYASVQIQQTAPESHPVLRPHRIGVGLYDFQGTALVRRQRTLVDIDPAVDRGLTRLAKLTGVRRPALLVLNDGDLSFVKIRFDTASLATLHEHLPDVADDETRALLWSAVRDLVRDAEWSALSFVRLVASGAFREPEIDMVEGLLQTARPFADTYLEGGQRSEALLLLADACQRLLDSPNASSQLRLVASRSLIGSSVNAALLCAWLEGRQVPAGISVNADLRWRVLHRLAVLGGISGHEIDAELRRDTTSEGATLAARCRAALADPAAKERAWQAVMRRRTLPSHLLIETARGLWEPEQLALMRPYVERYFEDMPQAAQGEPALMTSLARLAFPAPAIEPRTLTLVEAALTQHALPPFLRNCLLDQTDRLQRALTARARFAGEA